jgi:hypothetical protein
LPPSPGEDESQHASDRQSAENAQHGSPTKRRQSQTTFISLGKADGQRVKLERQTDSAQ